MIELRSLRPYLDPLVEEMLERVPDRPVGRRRAVVTPRRWIAAVALVVVAVVVLAIVLTRSTTSGSVRIPPAQQQNADPPVAEDASTVDAGRCSWDVSASPANSYFDRATGQTITMSRAEFCAQAAVARPYDSNELSKAGLMASIYVSDRRVVARYEDVVVTETPGGMTVTGGGIPVPADEVARRVAAANGTPGP